MAEEMNKPTEEKTPAEVTVEKEVDVAIDKPTETPPTAPAETTDGPDKEDIDNILMLLNSVQADAGGTGEISDIPPDLIPSMKYILGKLMALRDMFEDPSFKELLDDMVDQRDDGKTPSTLVAAARVFGDQIQNLADTEEYGEVQSAIDARLADNAQAAKDEEALMSNIDNSIAEINAYATEMNYDEDETNALNEHIAMLRDAFADGKLTREEIQRIDEGRNYERDTNDLRNQLPAIPKKEVLPDNASVETTMATNVAPKPADPRNSIEGMGAMGGGVDVTKIGKRKFVK